MGRAPCCDKANVKKGPWSPEEDAKLKAYIEQNGTGGNWIALPQKIGLKRCGKSCRLRWLNYLRPNIKHGGFSEEEDNIICSLYISIGSRWSIIAAQLPGRTDNDIKNYWNTRLKKKLLGKQRKEQAVQARRANNNNNNNNNGLNKQEMVKKENTEHGFLISQTVPYWPELPTPVMLNSQSYNDVVSHQLKVVNDNDHDHQASSSSIKNLLIKLGGRFSDIQTPTNTTTTTSSSTTDFQYYPSFDHVINSQDQAYNQTGTGSGTSFFENMLTYSSGYPNQVVLPMTQYGTETTVSDQVLEKLQAELSQLIYSGNPQESYLDGSEGFFGMENMVTGSRSNGTSTASNSVDSGRSSCWGEMNSSSSLVNYPSANNYVLSDYGNYNYNNNQLAPDHDQDSRFYVFGQSHS